MSFYEFVHPLDLEEVVKKHLALSTPNSTEKSAILLIRMQSSIYSSQKPFGWTHVVMQLKEPTEQGQLPLIINTIQILSDRETRVLRQNKWLYEHYSIHAKMQYGLHLGNAQFAKLSSSQSSDNGANSSTNSGSPLSQIVLNSNGCSNGHGVKRSRSSANSPVNGHPYMFTHHSQLNRSRLSSPAEHQLHCNTQNGLPSPTTAASIAAISPAMPNAKSAAIDSKYTLTNENSNSSTNLTSEAYLTANSNYGINLSPSDHTAVHSSALHHAAAAALNPIAPLNVSNDSNSLAVAPFHAHNLLQYSPQAGSLPTYPSFGSSSTNLFAHSPQHASSVITNTTPPATPPEIHTPVQKYSSSSSNNSSLNSNSSSHNGSSNKRSLSSSNSSQSNPRSSPEPKRAYLGQNSSFSHYNNGYAGFNHHYTYNVNINVNNAQNSQHLQSKKLQSHLQQQAGSQTQMFNQHQSGAQSGQQYSSFANRWLPIAANSFSDLMPSMSNYYNAAAAHSTHQLNQLAHQQLSNAAHQILPNININANTIVSNHSSINQSYHHHLNYHSRSLAGQKLNNLFGKDTSVLDQHFAPPVSEEIAIY